MRHNGTVTPVGGFIWIIVTILWNKFFMYSQEVFPLELPVWFSSLIFFRHYNVISLPGSRIPVLSSQAWVFTRGLSSSVLLALS